MDIVQIIYEEFNNRKLVPGSEYERLNFLNADNEIKLRDSLSVDQQKFLDAYNQSTDELSCADQYELIKFVLTFVKNTINFQE